MNKPKLSVEIVDLSGPDKCDKLNVPCKHRDFTRGMETIRDAVHATVNAAPRHELDPTVELNTSWRQLDVAHRADKILAAIHSVRNSLMQIKEVPK